MFNVKHNVIVGANFNVKKAEYSILKTVRGATALKT